MQEKTTTNRNLGLAGLAVATAVILVAGSFWIVFNSETVLVWLMDVFGVEQGIPERHYVPEGYTGWVMVRYNMPDAPELAEQDGAIIFEYDRTGRLETSSSRNDGVKKQEFFSWEDGQPVELHLAGRGEEFLIGDPPPGEKRIWQVYTASEYVEGGEAMGRLMSGFFVGTKEQYEASELPDLW